jgi:phosphoribosylaminoimidazolecarboxamide formyltransferase/IMP cyclohydrolase
VAEQPHNIVRVRRALISVSDKNGLIPFAASLASLGVEIISTGGTAKAIRDAGIIAKDVSEVTNFPEVFGGRLKTLHPSVHGGLLFERDNQEHIDKAAALGIIAIDLLAVNLYPFELVVQNKDIDERTANENIDIGGPAMIRGAAKNHAHVAVVTNPLQYTSVIDEIRDQGGTTLLLRQTLKAEAFALTARYDTAIARYFSGLYRVSNM